MNFKKWIFAAAGGGERMFKLKHMFWVGALSAILAVAIILIINRSIKETEIYDVSVLLFLAIFNMIISAIILIFTYLLRTGDKDLFDQYTDNVTVKFNRLDDLNGNLEKTLDHRNAIFKVNYDAFDAKLQKDSMISSALQNHIMFLTYKSSIGTLMSGKKKEAQEKIEETKKTLNNIINNPLIESERIKSNLNAKTAEFRKLESTWKERTGGPRWLYHTVCNQFITCPSCGNPVFEGEVKHR